MKDEIYTSYNERAWLLSEGGALFFGQVNTKGQREGEGTLYAANAHHKDRTLNRSYMLGISYEDKSIMKNR